MSRTMNAPIPELTDRMRQIFGLVVEAYIERGAPVGSKMLTGSVSLSPASIRGVMQDLEELGLLSHPHTSAGRMPTETGLRLFVDGLLSVSAIDSLSDSPLGARIVFMAAGVLVIGFGSAFYIGAGMGAGPRDSLMLVVADRTHTRIGVARAAIEVAVTVFGFALGGTVGIGTLAFAFGIGPAVELSFWTLERTPFAEPAPSLPQVASG